MTIDKPRNAAIAGFTLEAPNDEPGDTYRDYAAYTFVDRAGIQWLSQTLLSRDGATYHSRFCPVHDTRGTVWEECENWEIGSQTAELGIGLHFISGLGMFVYRNSNGAQMLAQTAFNAKGDERLGRICPIGDKRPVLDQCSPWAKLGAPSADLGVEGVGLFRDNDIYAFNDSKGAPVFAQRMLSVDGSQSWHQTCAQPSMLFEPTKACEWSSASAVSGLELYGATSVSGWGAHVYRNNNHQVFTETAISPDGTKAARRECLIGNRAVDERSCSPWSYRSLGDVLMTNQTML